MAQRTAEHDGGRSVTSELHELVEILDHEVRTPLALVAGWTEILGDSLSARRPGDDAVLDRLTEAVGDLAQLVERILVAVTRRIAADDELDGPALMRLIKESLALEG